MFGSEGTGDSILSHLDTLNRKILDASCRSVDELPREDGTEVIIRL